MRLDHATPRRAVDYFPEDLPPVSGIDFLIPPSQPLTRASRTDGFP
jgi:hypothetical protein